MILIQHNAITFVSNHGRYLKMIQLDQTPWQHVCIRKREQGKTVILYFIDKTTDGDLVDGRQVGANLEC